MGLKIIGREESTMEDLRNAVKEHCLNSYARAIKFEPVEYRWPFYERYLWEVRKIKPESRYL